MFRFNVCWTYFMCQRTFHNQTIFWIRYNIFIIYATKLFSRVDHISCVRHWQFLFLPHISRARMWLLNHFDCPRASGLMHSFIVHFRLCCDLCSSYPFCRGATTKGDRKKCGNSLYVLFGNIAKAFDRLRRDAIWATLTTKMFANSTQITIYQRMNQNWYQ